MTPDEAATLHTLLTDQTTAALATLHRAEPAVSMVPFALLPSVPAFVIHVSRLATHTQDMLDHPTVGLLVNAPPGGGVSPLALPRANVQGRARALAADDALHATARAAYLARLPDAEPLFGFADFSLFLIEPVSLRFVAGFGRAMAVTPERLRALLAGAA